MICIFYVTYKILLLIVINVILYDIMTVIFVSSRGRGRLGKGVNRQQNRLGDTVNITVPSDLIL